jgi:chloride channel, nucleotide-sensitive, 1A
MTSSHEKPVAISAPPQFLTPEQHSVIQQTTPDDFSQVPPVLRRKEAVTVTITLDLDGFPASASRGVDGDLYVTEG